MIENNFKKLNVKVNFTLIASLLAGDPLESGHYIDQEEDDDIVEIHENIDIFLPKEGTLISSGLIILTVILFPSLVYATSFFNNGEYIHNKLFKPEEKLSNDANSFNLERWKNYLISFTKKNSWKTWLKDPTKLQPETKILLEAIGGFIFSYLILGFLKEKLIVSYLNKNLSNKVEQVLPEVQEAPVVKEIFTTISDTISSSSSSFEKPLPKMDFVTKGKGKIFRLIDDSMQKSFERNQLSERLNRKLPLVNYEKRNAIHNKNKPSIKDLAAAIDKKSLLPKPIKPISLELIPYEPPKNWGNQ